MTITVQFNKVLPTHLAVAFVAALASFSREQCEVTVTFSPAQQDHMELHLVSGKVVLESMWEQPLGEIFSSFDCIPDREEPPGEPKERISRKDLEDLRSYGTNIICQPDGVAKLKTLLGKHGSSSLSTLTVDKLEAFRPELVKLHAEVIS